MFSRFFANSSSRAQHFKPDHLVSRLKIRRNFLYAGLLSGGFLLSGTCYSFIKDLFEHPEAIETPDEDPGMNKDEARNISVVTYVNFDTREEPQRNYNKPLAIETPHLDKHKLRRKGEEGEIRGVITDERGVPVNSADVLLYRNDTLAATTYTMGNGEFSFPGIRADAYTLKVLRDGYRELDYPEFKMASNATTFLDICLEFMNDTPYPDKIKNTLSKMGKKDQNTRNTGNFAVTVMIENPYGTNKK